MYGSPFFLVHSKLIFISTNKPNFLVGSKSKSTVEQSLIPLQIYSNTMGTMARIRPQGRDRRDMEEGWLWRWRRKGLRRGCRLVPPPWLPSTAGSRGSGRAGRGRGEVRRRPSVRYTQPLCNPWTLPPPHTTVTTSAAGRSRRPPSPPPSNSDTIRSFCPSSSHQLNQDSNKIAIS